MYNLMGSKALFSTSTFFLTMFQLNTMEMQNKPFKEAEELNNYRQSTLL